MLEEVAKATRSGARTPWKTAPRDPPTAAQMVTANRIMVIAVTTTLTMISLPSTGTNSSPPRATSPATMHTSPRGRR